MMWDDDAGSEVMPPSLKIFIGFVHAVANYSWARHDWRHLSRPARHMSHTMKLARHQMPEGF
jgi:hypothetical protein